MWQPQPNQAQHMVGSQQNGRPLRTLAGGSHKRKPGNDTGTVWRQIVNVEDDNEDGNAEPDLDFQSSLMTEDFTKETSYSTRSTFRSTAGNNSRASFGSSTFVRRIGKMSNPELDRCSFQSSAFVKRFGGLSELEPRDSFKDDTSPSFTSDGVVVGGVGSILKNRRANEGVLEQDNFMGAMQVASILRNRATLAGSTNQNNFFDLGLQPETETTPNEFTVNLRQASGIAVSSACHEQRECTTHTNHKELFKAGDKSAQGTLAEDDPRAQMSSLPHLPQRPQHPMGSGFSPTQRKNFGHRRYSNGNVDVGAVGKIASKYVATLTETCTTVDDNM